MLEGRMVEAALLPGRYTLRSASREDASRTAAACTILLVQTLSTRQTVEGRVPYRDDTYRLLVALGFRPPAPGEELYRSEDCGTDPEDAKDLAPWLPDVQEKKDNGDGRAWMIDMDVLLSPENARLYKIGRLDVEPGKFPFLATAGMFLQKVSCVLPWGRLFILGPGKPEVSK